MLAAAEQARTRIAPYVRRTPILRHQLDGFAGELHLKLEYLQVSGSFKARGACNRLLSASPAELARGVVTASGGNHGIAVAYAAMRCGVPARVFLPRNAPANTETRLTEYGATAVRCGATWDEAWAEAVRTAEGAMLVHPFEDAEVIAGQGTIALELMEQVPSVDLVLVAIGGGGLAGGLAATLHGLNPHARIVGVEPTGAPSMTESIKAKNVVRLPRVDTIAGTLAPQAVGPRTLALASEHIAQIELVSDREMLEAMRSLWREARILVEPSGAAAWAALRSGRVSLTGVNSTVVLLCGANLDANLATDTLAT